VQFGTCPFWCCASFSKHRHGAHVRNRVQDEISTGGFSVGTLSTLTSLFVLLHAKEQYGWTPESTGMSEAEASLAAATFGKFDSNEDNRLEFSEFRSLCNAADFSLSDEESKRAVQLLDKRGSGYIEFDEFAAWWKVRHCGLLSFAWLCQVTHEIKILSTSHCPSKNPGTTIQIRAGSSGGPSRQSHEGSRVGSCSVKAVVTKQLQY
jgi:EF-hand domain pair